MRKLLLLFTISILTFAACSHNTPTKPPQDDTASQDNLAYNENSDIQMIAKDTIRMLKNNDMGKLSTLVHAEKGLRFSPYVNVNPATDRKLTKEEIRTALEGDTIYYWGIYDGSGEPINLTTEKYFERFIYSKDFSVSTEISISTTELRTYGNIIDNTFDIYPGATVVQYHLPGTNPEYGGMDWQSLRLVFEKEGETWYLIGIIHDEWTS